MKRKDNNQDNQRGHPLRVPSVAEGMAVLVAIGLDALGEPPVALHPVVWYGKLIDFLQRRAPASSQHQLWYGAAMGVWAAPFALIPTLFVQRRARSLVDVCRKRGYARAGIAGVALIEGICLKPFFALNMLVSAGKSVRLALERQDLIAAREALQQLVSRDRSQLSTELVAAATIESLAENVSDSVTAPLFYYALFGLPGAALYRLYNTFDSMIGYHGRYEYLGKFAARLDDVLNYIPARLTALLIIALAPCYGGVRRPAWQIWRRDAARTESPNAGHPMAAVAGALGVQLEKVDHYVLGDAHSIPDTRRMRQAECMVCWVGGSVVLLAGLATSFRGVWRWRRKC
jgi:cobalamin biosynthesis protein CobD